jgi:ribonuclease Z
MEADDNTAASAPAQAGPAMPQNPYGGNPGSGLQFPPYCKPTPSVRSRNNYFPGSETLGPDARRQTGTTGTCS